MTEQVKTQADASTRRILSDSDIENAVTEMDDPMSPSVNDVRDALDAVQEAAENNILYSADDEDVVHETDSVYIVDDGENRDGLTSLLNDANVTDDDLRNAVMECHSHAVWGHHDSTRWDVSQPLIVARDVERDADYHYERLSNVDDAERIKNNLGRGSPAVEEARRRRLAELQD